MIIKKLHHTTATEGITKELKKQRLSVCNVINVKDRITKETLQIFFVELEPATNSKQVYDIKFLVNRRTMPNPQRLTNILYKPQGTKTTTTLNLIVTEHMCVSSAEHNMTPNNALELEKPKHVLTVYWV